MDKVLVYCPLNPVRPNVHFRTLESINALEWDNFDVVYGESEAGWTPANNTDKNRDILRKYNQARDMVLADGYDALLTVEADMIVPPDAIRRLSQTGADVSYGLYVSRHGKHGWLMLSKVTEKIRGSKPMGKTWQERQEMWGKVIDTAGVGLGCTLIKREVLEEIPFRGFDEWVANDWYFAFDAQEKGFTQAHDCGVVCGHIDNYRVLWPDISQGYIVTDEEQIDIEELMNMADGKYITLVILDLGDRFAMPGEDVQLSADVAKVLLKKRVIKPAKPEKELKEVKDYGSNN